MNYAELGTLLGGIAAMLSVLFVIGVKAAKCISDRSTKDIITATTASVQRYIASQMMRHIDGRDPHSYYTLDMNFTDGKSMHIPMIPGVSLMVLENISLTVIDHNKDATILSLVCVGHGYIQDHCHKVASESLRVERGLITCQKTGKHYRSGDIFHSEPGEFHAAYFHDCVAIVTLKPSLPTAATSPVDLAVMSQVFPP